jgi:hypothetical protein
MPGYAVVRAAAEKGGQVSRKIILAVVAVVLALSAGVAYAATQTTASGGTNVCVNDTNGLVRVTNTCREGEHPLTIGGGGGTSQVTQNGTFNVPYGETGGGKVLPLTGVTVSGRCEVFSFPGPFGNAEGANARALVEAASGTTMDFFPGNFNASPKGVTSRLLPPSASLLPGMGVGYSVTPDVILTSNGATATLTIGGYVDADSRTCMFLWQAIEAPN